MNKNANSKSPLRHPQQDRVIEKKAHRLRLLYLDFDVGYMNPTRALLPKILGLATDLTLFGPGYSTPEEVEAGPLAFVEQHGPFDAVMGNEYALMRPGFSEEFARNSWFLNHACRFDRSWIIKGAEYFTFMRDFPGYRFLSLFQLDHYGLTKDFVEMFTEISDYQICWGREFLQKKSYVSSDTFIPSGANQKIYDHWNDNYLDFVTRNENRILSTPEYVTATKMCDTPLNQRQCPWSVLGADYDARVHTREILDDSGIKRAGAWLPYIHSLADQIGFNIFSRYWTIGLMNWLFTTALRRSRYGYTCGSILRWPITKYYEIPANGCVLVSEPCNGFTALGFEHKKNAIACSSKEILDIHAWLEADPERAQAIADAGRNLIAKRHTVEARALQLEESFLRIQEDRFHGSYWEEGSLRFRRPVKAKMVASEC